MTKPFSEPAPMPPPGMPSTGMMSPTDQAMLVPRVLVASEEERKLHAKEDQLRQRQQALFKKFGSPLPTYDAFKAANDTRHHNNRHLAKGFILGAVAGLGLYALGHLKIGGKALFNKAEGIGDWLMGGGLLTLFGASVGGLIFSNKVANNQDQMRADFRQLLDRYAEGSLPRKTVTPPPIESDALDTHFQTQISQKRQAESSTPAFPR